MGGPCDFSVSPSPFDLDFGTLDFGTSYSGLTIVVRIVVHLKSRFSHALQKLSTRMNHKPGCLDFFQSSSDRDNVNKVLVIYPHFILNFRCFF